MIDLNILALEIHEAAVAKGFWDVEDAESKHLAKMISELGEVVQADRAGVMYEIEHEGGKPEGVVAELADFVMMALDLNAVAGYEMPKETPIEDWMDKLSDERLANVDVCNIVCVLCCTLTEDRFSYSIENAAKMLCLIYRWLALKGYDLWQLIRQKMEYNKSRPALHGRKY